MITKYTKSIDMLIAPQHMGLPSNPATKWCTQECWLPKMIRKRWFTTWSSTTMYGYTHGNPSKWVTWLTMVGFPLCFIGFGQVTSPPASIDLAPAPSQIPPLPPAKSQRAWVNPYSACTNLARAPVQLTMFCSVLWPKLVPRNVICNN